MVRDLLGSLESVRFAAALRTSRRGGQSPDLWEIRETAECRPVAQARGTKRGNERTRHPRQLRNRRASMGVQLHPGKEDGHCATDGAVRGGGEAESERDEKPHGRRRKRLWTGILIFGCFLQESVPIHRSLLVLNIPHTPTISHHRPEPLKDQYLSIRHQYEF